MERRKGRARSDSPLMAADNLMGEADNPFEREGTETTRSLAGIRRTTGNPDTAGRRREGRTEGAGILGGLPRGRTASGNLLLGDPTTDGLDTAGETW